LLPPKKSSIMPKKADAGWVKMAAPAVITAAASLRGSFIGKSLLVSILV